jgi:sporulation protein YlmC with PRC-barrel domain
MPPNGSAATPSGCTQPDITTAAADFAPESIGSIGMAGLLRRLRGENRGTAPRIGRWLTGKRSALPFHPAHHSTRRFEEAHMNKLALGTALSALMVSAALAQAPAPSATPSSPSASGSMNVVPSQQPDQMLASKFKGTDVIGTDNTKIGDVSDILFDKDGKIDAYIISVGGFLGVGSKHVALAPSAFTVVKGTGTESDKLRLTATKDQLKEAQNFEYYQAQRTTTGSGATVPSGAMKPSTGSPPASSR